ncbi:MAG TPA: hypothetical protein VIS07_10930 [Candidatus Binatia bacterium]
MRRISGRAVTLSGAAWREQLAALVERAPAWMRERASSALHIGGFTNVALEHPVLDAGANLDDDAAERVLVFFLAAAIVHGATLARVHCGSAARGRVLADAARRTLRGAATRIDDDNVALLRYFDVYLKPPSDLTPRTGERLRQAAQRAVFTAPDAGA